jgi:hypothetical protein
MKMRHNKKRNTYFLFEALNLELTKAIVGKNDKKKKVILETMKTFFMGGQPLRQEYDLYKTVVSPHDDITPRQAQKVFNTAVDHYKKMDKRKIFDLQTKLINKINKEISPSTFDNFVPSYTSMATAYQVFNGNLNPKQKVIFEERILGLMTEGKQQPLNEVKVPKDKLVYKLHTKKFNEKFSSGLLVEQKTLLTKYINSFADNGLDFKVFLNEELLRIKDVLVEKSKEDQRMNEVVETINGFKGQWITNDLLEKIMKLQDLAAELSR